MPQGVDGIDDWEGSISTDERHAPVPL